MKKRLWNTNTFFSHHHLPPKKCGFQPTLSKVSGLAPANRPFITTTNQMALLRQVHCILFGTPSYKQFSSLFICPFRLAEKNLVLTSLNGKVKDTCIFSPPISEQLRSTSKAILARTSSENSCISCLKELTGQTGQTGQMENALSVNNQLHTTNPTTAGIDKKKKKSTWHNNMYKQQNFINLSFRYCLQIYLMLFSCSIESCAVHAQNLRHSFLSSWITVWSEVYSTHFLGELHSYPVWRTRTRSLY